MSQQKGRANQLALSVACLPALLRLRLACSHAARFLPGQRLNGLTACELGHALALLITESKLIPRQRARLHHADDG